MSTPVAEPKRVYFDLSGWAYLRYADTNDLAYEGPRDYCLKVAEYEQWVILDATPASLIQDRQASLEMVKGLLFRLKDEGGLDCANTEINCGHCTSCLLRKWMTWEK